MGLQMNARDEYWLPSLNAVRIPEGTDAKALCRHLLLKHGIEIAGGLGDLAGKIVRIGCMGHSAQPRNVLNLLPALGDALGEQGVEVDVDAGLAAAAGALDSA
jgi:alanine-glyoxylate transaminase/serine-glyoxylate transaminase/serine-pyruvate transaminase